MTPTANRVPAAQASFALLKDVQYQELAAPFPRDTYSKLAWLKLAAGGKGPKLSRMKRTASRPERIGHRAATGPSNGGQALKETLRIS